METSGGENKTNRTEKGTRWPYEASRDGQLHRDQNTQRPSRAVFSMLALHIYIGHVPYTVVA